MRGMPPPSSPEELSAILDGARYDLVLTEYAAPGWSWRAALEALRGLRRTGAPRSFWRRTRTRAC